MEAVHARNVLAEIFSTFPAGAAQSANPGTIDRHKLAGKDVRNARADFFDRSRCLSSDHKRQFAFGEGHPAPSPNVNVIEGHSADTQSNLAGSRVGRLGKDHTFQPAVLDKLQCAHASAVPELSVRDVR
jgi:hypothetical protein